jgi:hypothetical protein
MPTQEHKQAVQAVLVAVEVGLRLQAVQLVAWAAYFFTTNS